MHHMRGGMKYRSRRPSASQNRPWKGTYQRTKLPNFLDIKSIEPFINNELASVLSLVEYETPQGGKGREYRAEILPIWGV